MEEKKYYTVNLHLTTSIIKDIITDHEPITSSSNFLAIWDESLQRTYFFNRDKILYYTVEEMEPNNCDLHLG